MKEGWRRVSPYALTHLSLGFCPRWKCRTGWLPQTLRNPQPSACLGPTARLPGKAETCHLFPSTGIHLCLRASASQGPTLLLQGLGAVVFCRSWQRCQRLDRVSPGLELSLSFMHPGRSGPGLLSPLPPWPSHLLGHPELVRCWSWPFSGAGRGPRTPWVRPLN